MAYSLPEIGLETSGSVRPLAVRDRASGQMLPLANLDTTTRRFGMAATVDAGAMTVADPSGGAGVLAEIVARTSNIAHRSDASRLYALGWRGDNTNLTLASKFSSLAAAQLFFPSAQSLTEYLDGCCIERVLQINTNYFGRSSIQIPAGGSRVSRTIETTGSEVSIRGAGRGATQIILFTSGTTLFRHGLGAVAPAPGQPGQRQFQIENLRLDCEVDPTGTRALDISYNTSVGFFFQTTMLDVDIRGFQSPIRIRNPGRGLRMDRVSVFGPDNTCQQTAAIEIITDQTSSAHSAEACFRSVRTANYRWGWDVQMKLGDGSNDAQREANRKSMEGFIFIDCGSYNGWGMVRAVNEYTTYSALLWEFIACDWQGAGNALDLTRCNQIIVRGGFWIANTAGPAGDSSDPLGYPERRYMVFHQCENVRLENLRIDVQGNFPSHILIDTDTSCKDVRISNCTVRDYSPNAKAGFRIAGAEHNTIKEFGTYWQVWASPEDNKVYDIFANQLSQTRAKKYGSVDDTGEYQFRGRASVTLDSNGNALIQLPRRPATAEANGGNVTPFFLRGAVGEPDGPYIHVTPRSSNYRVSPTVNAASQWEFIITCGPGQAGQQFDVDWTARGR